MIDDEEERKPTLKMARVEVPPSRRAPDEELELADALLEPPPGSQPTTDWEMETPLPCPLIDTIEQKDHAACELCAGARFVSYEQRQAWIRTMTARAAETQPPPQG